VDLGTIRLPPASGSVSGVVVDATGAPAARVPVFVNSLPGLDQPRRSAITNEKGEFTVTRVCAGPARLQARFASDPGGPGFLVTELPAHGVKIVLGKELAHTPETSILSKPLPALTDLSAALSHAPANGRPILLYLVDIEQRPSRNCLTQLAKQANTLADRDIAVIVVQVSRVDLKGHDAFLKANHIALPIHVVDEGFEIRKSVWGVRSLPWLILTDIEHIVRAEGFGISELEPKIRLATHGQEKKL
jgi:hypothetical protein